MKGDGITNVNTPVITGTGVAGDTITLFDGLNSVGTGIVGADGKWSITSGALAQGAHTLTATETDPAGNASGSSAILPVTEVLQPPKSAFDAAGDLFLSGSYFEIGISYAGNFGANKDQTPAGYAQPDSAWRWVGL